MKARRSYYNERTKDGPKMYSTAGPQTPPAGPQTPWTDDKQMQGRVGGQVDGRMDGWMEFFPILQVFPLLAAAALLLTPSQSPIGIITSAVPLPCFFDVVKSQKVAG